MNEITKAHAYWSIACDVLDYMESCSRKHIVPLLYDVNVFRKRLRKAAYGRRKCS